MSGKTEETIRTMELLWRSPDTEAGSTSPGPKPRLTVDDVVEAAIAVADANGMGGVSMRAVAERLGVTPMALYGYVPSKKALVALIYDAIHADLSDQQGAGGWRDRVMVWADDLLELYVRHPWALSVSYARPVLGPNEQQVLERVALILRETDLYPDLLRRVVGTVFHMIRGTALTIAEGHDAAETSGVSEQEWWHRSSTALAEVVPDFTDRYPHTVWLLSEPAGAPTSHVGYVDQHSRENLRVGLEMLLDGVLSGQGRHGPQP